MFESVRKHTKIMMMVMFLLIIPSFVLLGIDGYNRSARTDVAVARVGSQEITQAQWDSAHRAQADRVRAANPKIDAKLLDSPEARYATLENLLHERVLAISAEQARLVTSDGRLARYLQEDRSIAALRKADGKLDMERYRQLAASQGLTPEGFENNVRLDISRQQLEAAVVDSGFATTRTAELALDPFFEKREVQVRHFLAADYSAKISPTQAELNAFYQSNQALFQAPEQAQVEYVVLDLESVKKSIQITPVDLQSYYEQNAARLSGTEQRRASHILITVNKNAPASERDKARSKAQDLLKLVRAAPASFAEVAKKNSQDPGSASKGGDLDFFAHDAMVKPFADAVFSMQKDAISELVESDFGFHIIRLTDIRTPKLRSFDELRARMEADLKAQQAQRKYAEVAEIFSNTVYEQSDSLKPVADKLKLEIKTVDHLARHPGLTANGVLASEKFLAALFSSESRQKKRNTEAVEIAMNQLAAGRVVNYSAAHTLSLAEVQDPLRARLVANRAAELAKQDGLAKLAQWKKDASSANLPAAIVVSRDAPEKLTAPEIVAALRLDPASLPNWTGVELPGQGFALLRVNRVLAKAANQPSAQPAREQYTQWWTSAEAQAYYAVLKARLKAEILLPAPAKNALLSASKTAP